MKPMTDKFINIVLNLLIIGAIFVLIFSQLISTTQLKGESMYPTLSDGKYKINRFIYTIHSPERNDVIVFQYGSSQNKFLCKRVIAIPGDNVLINDTGIFLNGIKIDESFDYGIFSYNAELKLEADEYFVLGDNRANSYDSRDFGPIKLSSIKGKLIY